METWHSIICLPSNGKGLELVLSLYVACWFALSVFFFKPISFSNHSSWTTSSQRCTFFNWFACFFFKENNF